jgi:hypothetical protein
MKHVIRISLFFSVFLIASSGFAVSRMKVTVFNAAGKVAFKGGTSDGGTFATGSLQPGKYIVQFNSTTAAVKGQEYGLVISAGKKKVVAGSVAGEKFLGGGVAMRIEVGSGLGITGQIGPGLPMQVDPKTGERMVWLRPRIGTHMPGRWVPENSPELVSAFNSGEIRLEDVIKWQDHGDTR